MCYLREPNVKPVLPKQKRKCNLIRVPTATATAVVRVCIVLYLY